ncbi:MAG: calcium-binding protein [Pseudomonadota bacterium]
MTTLVGTNGDEQLRVEDLDVNFGDTLFGRGGDDTLISGRGQDSLFGGRGDDRLDGGRQIDFYHFVEGSGNDLLDEYENLTDLNGSAQNNADRLRFWTPDTEFTNERFLDLEYISDAFLVLQGETFDPPETPFSSGVEYSAFFFTSAGDSLQIEDQYGNDDPNQPQDPTDAHDGAEFLDLRHLNSQGNRSSFQYIFNENQQEIEARVQRGDSTRSEWFMGSRQADSIFGNSGRDVIFSGDGDDSLFGGDSTDHLHASRGVNYLNGGNGADYYYWNRDFRATNTIEEDENSTGDLLAADFEAADLNRAFADGVDLVLAYSDPKTRSADPTVFRVLNQFNEDAMLVGYDVEFIRFAGKLYQLQEDFVSPGGTDAGELIAMAQTGGDVVRAGAGDDIVFGNRGADNLQGQGGSDILIGGNQADRLQGGGGGDLMRGGAGADRLNGGRGEDTADYRTSEEGVQVDLGKVRQSGGDAQGDRLRDVENVVGSERGDALRGDGGANALEGRGGRDLMRAGAGNDEILGEGGADRGYGGGGRDQIRGGSGGDRLWGDGGADRIWVGGGGDRAWGGAGNDRIWGGGGADSLWGNAGNDTFYGSRGRDTYYVGPGDDRIIDFADGRDKIAFSGPDKPGGMRDLRITENGSSAVVRWDGGRATLDDTDQNQLTRADFIF